MKRLYPFLLILFGLFLLFLLDQAPAAGVCLLIAIVMIFQQIWPEEWESEKLKKE